MSNIKDIILIALEHEAPKMAKWENVFFTGVGKVNAALIAGKLIERFQPRTVWNFGTAGGIKLGLGLHEMKNFVERDKGKCPESINIVLPKHVLINTLILDVTSMLVTKPMKEPMKIG